MKLLNCLFVPFIIFLWLFSGSTWASLVNGGFETTYDTTGTEPTGFGYWRGDPTEIVSDTFGITPLEGSQMVRHIFSSPIGPHSETIASQLWQLVDMSPFSAEIATGNVVASATAHFNRVLGDVQTDTRFNLSLYAYSGSPTTFPDQWWDKSELASGGSDIYTDGDITTWEMLSTSMLLPTGTNYVAIEISSEEDIFNDSVGTEFDGHFSDNVTLNISSVPIPSSVWIFGSGLIGLVGVARRRARV